MPDSPYVRRISLVATLGVLAIAASAWQPRPAAPLSPCFNHVMLTVAKALSAGKSPGKGQLVPFYGAMPQPDAVAAADDVPVTAIAPEAKVFQARA
jgi:hypothetical protein